MAALPTIAQFRYLLALHETKHFGRAADQSFVTQSTLSASLRDLEDVLDVQLVERDKRNVAFTAIGEQVVARAREVVNQTTDITELCQGFGAPLAGDFRLGAIPTIAPFVLPQLLPTLRKGYPALRLYLREEQTGQLLTRLGSGEIDAALIALPFVLPPTLEAREIIEDEFFYVASQAPTKTATSPITVDRVNTAQLLLLEDGHCLREHAIAACSLAESARERVLSASSLTTLLHMAASGLGSTLLPALAIDNGALKGFNLQARRMTPRGPRRTIAIVYRKTTALRADMDALTMALRTQLQQ
jgi:LysR family transcriptional regulator, hydrogen peroxide-inducible genes activator